MLLRHTMPRNPIAVAQSRRLGVDQLGQRFSHKGTEAPRAASSDRDQESFLPREPSLSVRHADVGGLPWRMSP